jgi:hypothetical protein
MESMLSTLTFAGLIGAQFLAAIVLFSKRNAIYGELPDPKKLEHPSSERAQTPAAEQELPAEAA